MIEARNLSVHYGGRCALRNVTVAFPARSVTAIVGPSGAGKSTLLAALNRLIDLVPDARVEGDVRFLGEDARAANVSPAVLRRRIGMIFQDPNPFPLSIEKNIQLALREHGVRDRGQLRAITRRVLEDVGLWEEVRDRLHHRADTLSGGQQQRLCIARALALQPEALLMDEPCSALDPIAARRIEALAVALAERYTVVVVTHDLASARRMATRAVVLWPVDGAGEIVEQGPAWRVFTSPRHPAAAGYLASGFAK